MAAQNYPIEEPTAALDALAGATHAASLPIPDLFRGLEAVAVAVISRQGGLKDANRGFLLLMTRYTPKPEAVDVRDLFISPRFDDILARPRDPYEGTVYRGPLSLGTPGGKAASLHGSIYLSNSDLLVVAEHDILRLETLRTTLRELQEDLSEKQRHVIHLEHRVARLQELADAAMRDRDTLLDALAHGGPGRSHSS